MTTFVLVSGAWHAGWCWERVTPLIEAAGARAVAPDLYGMGPDKTPLAQVSLALWADQVAELIRAQDEPVVLVGHSRGGIVVSEVAERVPERIARLVYLTAVLLPDGAALAGVTDERREERPERGDRQGYLVLGPDDTSTVAAERVGLNFYNTTAPEWVERAASLLTPEPMAVFRTPLRLTDERFGRVPRAYVECVQDKAIALRVQRAFQARLPCDPVVTLDTDHSPFYSAPEALAEALMGIARTQAAAGP
jgi:pimeloyl-ACP methyl ester carboxylesterase